jgi:hypothetical protein
VRFPWLSAELPFETYRADLVALLQSADHRLPRTDDQLRRMYQMIRDRVILRYSNHEQWEGVHPLVLAHIDRELFDRLVFPPICRTHQDLDTMKNNASVRK